MNKNYYFRCLLCLAALCVAPRLFADENSLCLVKMVSGDVQAQAPGSTTFKAVVAGEKLPVGVTFKTGPQSDAMICLVPGLCFKVGGNSVVTVSTIEYDDSKPPKRSVLIDLHSGRMVAIVERYFPGRTSYFVQTGEMEPGNIEAKDKSAALGGAWDAGSCGAATVTADSGYSRISQVVGTGSWTEANGSTSQIGAGNVLVDNDGSVAGSEPISGSTAAAGDQAYTMGAIRDAISSGLVDPAGCPGFSKIGLPGGVTALNDMVLGLPLNPANMGISTQTGSTPPGSPGSPNSPNSPNALPTPNPGEPTPSPPPVVSPSSLPAVPFSATTE